jgi:hypothetical protein
MDRLSFQGLLQRSGSERREAAKRMMVTLGLGRIVALHCRSSTSYQIR